MHNRVQYEPINADAFEQDSDSATSESSHVIEKQRLQPKEGCAKFCLHLRLLLLKNILLFWRSKKITLFQFLTPILCLLVIFVLQIIANDFQDINFPNPPVKDLNKLPHCKGDECITLGYGIIGDTNDTNSPDYEWIHHTVKYAAEKHNLKFGKDVQQIIMSNTTKSIKSYFDTHENKTWYGVVFCTTEWEDGITSNITIPCRAQNTHGEDPKIDLKFYSILYNFTLMPSTFLDNFTAPMKPDPVMLTIKNTIDSGILDYLKKKKANDNNIGLAYESEVDFDDGDPADIYIQSSYSNFPLVTSRFFKDANIMSLVGSFYLALGPLVCFVVIFTEVVKEKELKLRQGLSVVGLSHTSYWLHWMISGVFFSSLISITTILGGLAFQFDLFYNANLVIVFMLYFLFGIAMILFAFILSTMVSTQKVAYTVSYAFVLLAIIIQLVLTNSLVTFFLFFNDKSDSSIFFIRALFYMYPPFAYSLIFGLIVRKATTHFDENGQQFVKGTSFSWGDLVIPETGEFSIGDKYSSPTPLHCFGMLVMLIAIYLVFLWYFDHVISSNRGTNESFYFFDSKILREPML